MAIRYTGLGGTNYNNEIVTDADLNDTHNKIADIIGGFGGYGIISGCNITENGTPNLTATLSVGVVLVDGIYYNISSQTLTFTNADVTNPRWDLVSMSSTGTATVTAGTASTSPVMPAIPANHCALAFVYRATNDNIINTADILKYTLKSTDTGWAQLYVGNTNCSIRRLPMPNGVTLKGLKCIVTGISDADSTSSRYLALQVNDIPNYNTLKIYTPDGATYSLTNGTTGALKLADVDSTDNYFGGEFTVIFNEYDSRVYIRNNMSQIPFSDNGEPFLWGASTTTTTGGITSISFLGLGLTLNMRVFALID